MRPFLTLVCVALIPLLVTAQREDRRLRHRLDTLIGGFHGDIGIYVYDPVRDRTVAINADSLFPTASIVKVSLLIGIMDKIRRGELDYHQRLTYTDSLYYSEGDDILSAFKSGSTIELSKVIMLMLTISDNCASLWIQGLDGGGVRVNQILDSLGFVNTRVNSRTPGREMNRATYGWGQTTPREIVQILSRIVDGALFSRAISDQMLRLLGRQYWDEEALSQIPAGIFVADKNGAVDHSRNEVVYVHGKHPYLFSIFTKNNADSSWTPNNEAWVLTRKVSALLWKYYDDK
jgi:beta-lactamase class A